MGSGGSLGTIQYRDLARELARGYATIATDNGHRSEAYDVSWALGRRQRIVDFGYRAEHIVTEAGRVLTKSFYKTPPKHSYFIGCSQGGHHALTEAERFPEDYDGIVAGAPVYRWTGEMSGQAVVKRREECRKFRLFGKIERRQRLFSADASQWQPTSLLAHA